MQNNHHELKVYSLKEITDQRGTLAVFEVFQKLGLEFKRIFFVRDAPPGSNRGDHGHKKCHQVLLCLSGSIEVTVDDGKKVSKFVLNSPNEALHIPPWHWGGQTYLVPDSVLLVLASDEFEVSDYIDSYPEFVEGIQKRSGK